MECDGGVLVEEAREGAPGRGETEPQPEEWGAAWLGSRNM